MKKESGQPVKKSIPEKRPKRDGFGKRLILKLSLRIVTMLLLLGTAFFGSRYAFGRILKVSVAKKHAMVERELSEVAELTLYKMRYSDIATIKKKNMLAKAYSIIRYVGTVRAGIRNISDTDLIISENGKTIDVILPGSEILGNDITSQEVFDEQRSIFLPITTQEVFDEIESARKEMVESLLQEGLLAESDERAKKLVGHMLEKFGFTEIHVMTSLPPFPQSLSDAVDTVK